MTGKPTRMYLRWVWRPTISTVPLYILALELHQLHILDDVPYHRRLSVSTHSKLLILYHRKHHRTKH
jgi:hypothetical protein